MLVSLCLKGASDSERLGEVLAPVKGVEKVKEMDLTKVYKYQTVTMYMMTLQLWVDLTKEKQESSNGGGKQT